MEAIKMDHALALELYIRQLRRLNETAPRSIRMFTLFMSTIVDELHIITDHDAFLCSATFADMPLEEAMFRFHGELKLHPMTERIRQNRTFLRKTLKIFHETLDYGALVQFERGFQAAFRSYDCSFLTGMGAPVDIDVKARCRYSEIWPEALKLIPLHSNLNVEIDDYAREFTDLYDDLEDDDRAFEYMRARLRRNAALLEHGWLKGIAAAVIPSFYTEDARDERRHWQLDLDAYDRYLDTLLPEVGKARVPMLRQMSKELDEYTLKIYPFAFQYGMRVGKFSV